MKQYNLAGILITAILSIASAVNDSGTGGTNPKEDAYSVRCKKDD